MIPRSAGKLSGRPGRRVSIPRRCKKCGKPIAVRKAMENVEVCGKCRGSR